MAYQDFFAGLKADLETQRAGIDAKEAAVDAASSDVDAQIKATGDARYNQGVVDGKAMIQLPDSSQPGAQYTQQQLSDAVTAGQKQQRDQDVAEFQPQLDTLDGQVKDLQAQVDAAAADKAQALKDLQDKLNAEIADLKAKFDAMASKVQAAEDEFSTNLAPQT